MKTIGQLADEMHDLRETKRELEEQVKIVQEKYDLKMLELFDLADAQDTTVGRGQRGSFTIGESVVPQVKDWDTFYKYIQKTKYWHLLERRPSVTGCRELFDTKGLIPGVDKFTKRTLNLRKV